MQKVLDFFDSLDFSVLGIVGVVGILTLLRLFLESFSSPESTGLFANPAVLVSYATLYGMLIMMFTLRLAALAKKSTLWALRVMTLIFPVVIITPLIDLIFSKGQGFCVGYIQSGGKSLGNLFLTFLGSHTQLCGMTPGLRIQIVGGMIIVSVIIFFITKSWWRSLLGAFISYTISFIGGALPLLVNAFTKTAAHPTFEASTSSSLISSIHYPTASLPFISDIVTMTSLLIGRVQFVVLIIGIAFVWFYGSRSTWKAWWLGSLIKIPMAAVPFIMMIFGLMVGFGGWEQIPTLLWADWLGIIILCLSLFLACWNVGSINDLADVSIDEVSNKDYPMIAHQLSPTVVATIRDLSFLLALIGAFLVNYNVLICMLVFIAGYTFHSSPHFLRLKRFWLTSSFCIVLANCAAFLVGFFALSPDQTVGHFPLVILGMTALLLFPYSIIKDVPDMAGDAVQSIATFPRMFGKKAALSFVIILLITWFVLFLDVIPWFFALGVIATLITFFAQPRLLSKKVLLFGIPTGTIALGMFLHIFLL